MASAPNTTSDHTAPRDLHPPGGAGVPPSHRDSPLESLGKAITDAVVESSGEAEQSERGEVRRAAGERARAQDERKQSADTDPPPAGKTP